MQHRDGLFFRFTAWESPLAIHRQNRGPLGTRSKNHKQSLMCLETFTAFLTRLLFPRSSWFVAVIVFAATSAAQDDKPVQSGHIKRGALSVQFQDNSQSPQILSGIDSLFNTTNAAGFDAYDPDEPRASAGLNFEHIISGHQNPNNKFTPRHGPYTLRVLPDGKSVVLTRRAIDSPWKVASTLKYTVHDPHSIDFEFRCTPEDASLFGTHGYALFFFANYMNNVKDIALHFRGHESMDAKEDWISADAPKGHADWNGGGNYRAITASDLPYDDDVKFRLNTWSYDWPRISRPFYYGRSAQGMTLILMFDRLHSDRDQIRFSLYKFKLPKHPRPAWDFQYVVNQVESGEQFGFRGRLVWKKFVSPEDCLHTYERWAKTLSAELPELPADRVQQLKQLGATVFTRSQSVLEVNANRKTIDDNDLALVSGFTQMTDLSLEETAIGDTGLSHLRDLQKLEWLNLYQTQIGNDGLKEIVQLRNLQHLPIGSTHVTDAGLAHLSSMKQLVYLGLRNNKVTDDGIKHLRPLVNLTGLHLGETKITNAGLIHLLGMTKLQTLWLDNTLVSDEAITTLGRLGSLRELHIVKTKITAAGVNRLNVLLPQCHITANP